VNKLGINSLGRIALARKSTHPEGMPACGKVGFPPMFPESITTDGPNQLWVLSAIQGTVGVYSKEKI